MVERKGNPNSVQPVQVERDDPLQAIDDGINAEIPEEYQADLQKVVLSGHQILYSKETHKDVMDGIRDIDDPSDARKVALGVAGIMTIINREDGGKIPVSLMVPAGTLLTVEVIRFLRDAGMVDPTPAFIGNSVEELLAALMQKMGMGKDKQQPQDQQGPQDNRIPAQGTEPAAPPPQQGGLIGAPA